MLFHRLADTLTSVAVLVAIDNWTKWTLLEPENEMNSGLVIDDELPESIEPGQSEMALFGKDVSCSHSIFLNMLDQYQAVNLWSMLKHH